MQFDVQSIELALSECNKYDDCICYAVGDCRCMRTIDAYTYVLYILLHIRYVSGSVGLA